MKKEKIELGEKIIVPIYNYKQQLIREKKGIVIYKGRTFLTMRTEEGYNESFYYQDIKESEDKKYGL